MEETALLARARG
jgi:glutamate dehydrogenase